ncbi:SUZ domain-containing protein 1-like isoform X2 [Xiphias gladius]|uniref:SUZ domain-containing protein 1-like isoform X2 n=1 Tax=Xiphias gladius TaxID=8245 RepID=UPI001A988FAE|nr:SUZ domain-containing protein 1-like isoform X2 [Xiphias gladius]
MEDEEVAESWEEAADSGEIERRLEAKLKINQEAKKSSFGSGVSPVQTAMQMKSLAQREAEYAEARRRILGSASSDETPQDNPCQDRTIRVNQPSEPVRPNNHVIRQPTGPDGTTGFRLCR